MGNPYLYLRIEKELGFSVQVLVFFFNRLKNAIYLVFNYSKNSYDYCSLLKVVFDCSR